jgi:hypothetical protein
VGVGNSVVNGGNLTFPHERGFLRRAPSFDLSIRKASGLPGSSGRLGRHPLVSAYRDAFTVQGGDQYLAGFLDSQATPLEESAPRSMRGWLRPTDEFPGEGARRHTILVGDLAALYRVAVPVDLLNQTASLRR